MQDSCLWTGTYKNVYVVVVMGVITCLFVKNAPLTYDCCVAVQHKKKVKKPDKQRVIHQIDAYQKHLYEKIIHIVAWYFISERVN